MRGGFLLLLLLISFSCRKEVIIVPDNKAPDYSGVPLVKIQNYVNRTYIDLLSREPLDIEMAAEVAALQRDSLSTTARLAMIVRLQTDTLFIEGDTSYQRAYYQNLYNLAKARCLEGAGDDEILSEAGLFLNGAFRDSLDGDWEGYARNIQEYNKLLQVLYGRQDLQQGNLTYADFFRRITFNAIYDKIHMNTLNFVNATFDNLLWRYPTKEEQLTGFRMIELNTPGIIFGRQGANKEDYITILTESREMYEGLIIWAYRQLLSRPPTSQETALLLEDFVAHKDFRLIQRHIMLNDEYAQF